MTKDCPSLRAGIDSINNRVSLLHVMNNEGDFKNKVIQNLPGNERFFFSFSPVIGQKMFVLLQDLIAPVKAGETEFNVLIKALRYFCSPEKNVFSNRF